MYYERLETVWKANYKKSVLFNGSTYPIDIVPVEFWNADRMPVTPVPVDDPTTHKIVGPQEIGDGTVGYISVQLTSEEVAQNLLGSKATGISVIKGIREQAHQKYTKCSGVLAIYDENYKASIALQDGSGATTIMKDGRTAEDYISAMALRFNETTEAFADYVVKENRNLVGPKMAGIEEKYLALCYAGDAETVPINSLSTITEVDAAVESYRTFCGV